MNVIVSNKNEGLLSSLDVEVIKSLNGEFTADEIIGTFSNFFFNRMFLDITAIKDYTNISNIQKLSIGLDIEKVILLLDNNLMADSDYISKLISMGIYNFGTDKQALMYLYSHPNTYKDVASYHLLNNNQSSSNPKIPSMISSMNNKIQRNEKTSKVIGFKNVTLSAGATTLIYMLKKCLSETEYTVAIEIDKNDFGYFNEKDMYSINKNNLSAAINKFNNARYILVDLNECPEESCDEVIYLIEPSTIKLNKLMLVSRNIFDTLYQKNIVLNKSLLSENDVKVFERESNAKIVYNIPPLNDHEKNSEVLLDFIKKLEL